MKRSRINGIMAEAGALIRHHGFALPPFASWTPEAFRARADAARHIIDARCGWDITDYGAGGFAEDRGGTVWLDGIRHAFAPGEKLRLAPGESVTLRPGDWHAFWGEGGDVLIGEVSTVNDYETDNIFRAPIGRFAEIEEDVAPTHLLVSDYARWLG